MNGLRKQPWRWSLFVGAFFAGAMALAGFSPRAQAQDHLQGEVVLPIEARFGNALLPAGTYRFDVQPIGAGQAIDFAVGGSNQVLVSMTGLAKGSPIAIAMGTASKATRRDPHVKNIRVDETGNTFHSMYLQNAGVMLKFYETKPKNAAHTPGLETSRGVTAAKGNV